MIRLPRKHLSSWRSAIGAGLLLFVVAQTISVAHMADLSLHTDGVACQICQAIGHAATPPAPAAAPVAAIQLSVATVSIDFVAAVLQPTFSSHAARAPPTFL
jgi:hypothetical protein